MQIIETIRYLNSEDGPNIPLRTLGAYCGKSHSALSQYLNAKVIPAPDIEKQLKQGVRELVMEINGECKWLFDRTIRQK